ncbi:MAG TPA: EAL domain-containing response regulator [Terriglobales bacterium]|nr:EAL domain-containing response regulator [Terriglobales bacterium]
MESKSHRVLIVDDDEQVSGSVAEGLRLSGYEVDCAAEAESAEALLASQRYSLLIADLALRDDTLDGLRLVETAAQRSPRPRIVALTGYVSRGTERAARQRGADEFLAKPQPIHQLLEVVRRLISEIGTLVEETERPSAPTHNSPLLRKLLAPGGILPHIQPIYRVSDQGQKLVGVELLTRGPKATPFERPDVLFDYVRRKGLEAEFDQHCIESGLVALGTIPGQLPISVNVHASTLSTSSRFPEWLKEILERHGIAACRMTVEIVEHAPAWNQGTFLRSLGSLRQAGIRIALDDVGLGHSNFKMLLDAQPDCFKVDRYFVQGCATDRQRRAMIRSIADLASEFGGYVVAEGIEEPNDRDALLSLQIQHMQGFLLCPGAQPLTRCESRSRCCEGVTRCPLPQVGTCLREQSLGPVI